MSWSTATSGRPVSGRSARRMLLLLGLCVHVGSGCVAYRAARWRAPAPEQQDRIFPGRVITRADEPFVFHRSPERTDLDTVTVRTAGARWIPWAEYMEAGRIRAFLVIRNDTILYERYRDGYTDRTLSGSYSIAKSITSALLGLALDDGSVASLDDVVTAYVPEARGNPAFQGVTLRHALEMRSGFAYRRATGRPLADLRSHDARFYYTTDLDRAVVTLRREEPPGGAWSYRDSDTQILAMAIARATGHTLAGLMEERIWRRIGTEADATWSLDRAGGTEKAATGFNATARDYARFARLHLHGGSWEGRQLLPEAWVRSSTTLDTTRTRPEVATWWRMQHRQQWWIPMHEWELHRDFYADGAKGQRLYVHGRSNTIIVQIADDDWHDFPFRRIALYLLGEWYLYPHERGGENPES
jgi:CubicO group peptidase (beta-lactamase class C family)